MCRYCGKYEYKNQQLYTKKTAFYSTLHIQQCSQGERERDVAWMENLIQSPLVFELQLLSLSEEQLSLGSNLTTLILQLIIISLSTTSLNKKEVGV